MKDFLKDKTWEDYLIWTIGGLMIFGLVLFLIGFMFQFSYDPLNLNIEELYNKTSISKMVKGDDVTNLFTLITDKGIEHGSKAFQMWAVAVSGFAIIMIDILIFLILFIFAAVMEWVVPRIKSKKNA